MLKADRVWCGGPPAIASLVRTEPRRARAPLLDHADCTRHSFHWHGEFTTEPGQMCSGLPSFRSQVVKRAVRSFPEVRSHRAMN
ncbi:hypothetical protein FRZ03_18945 [Streptomyces misionensis]|uniref:Uncharacterized protein n=1 Tax=Streptomyces misionensis TaxID=67331 RepID=A0A5C6JRE5_9ACTN|nr:hypothetical protein FRZ03_18945 [Streptomyces misionensis]